MAYSYAQLEGFWINAGGPPSAAPTAAAIALAESGGSNVEQAGQPYGTTGWGLWQITPGNSEPQFGSDSALLDPQANAQAAVAKFNQAGGSFAPWTTFTHGTYRSFLQGGIAPDTLGITTPQTGTLMAGTTSYDAGSFGSGWLHLAELLLGLGMMLVGAVMIIHDLSGTETGGFVGRMARRGARLAAAGAVL